MERQRFMKNLGVLSFLFVSSMAYAGVFEDPNATIVRWIHAAQDVPASEIESRVLNLHPYGAPVDPAVNTAPADGKPYLVFRNVQKNIRIPGGVNDRAGTSPYGALKTANPTNMGQYSGLYPASPVVSRQRFLSSAHTDTGSSGSQVLDSRFGAILNLWEVDHSNIQIQGGGPQAAVEIVFPNGQKGWTATNSILTVQSKTNVPFVNFGGAHPCDRVGVDPNSPLNMPVGTLSYGLYFKDVSTGKFLNLGTDLYDTRRPGVNCGNGALPIPSSGIPVEGTTHWAAGTLMSTEMLGVMTRLSVNSKYLDVSGYVAPDCRTTQMGIYNHECWIRIHIPYAKFKLALEYPDPVTGRPICLEKSYSCNPLDYDLAMFQIGAEMHNVAGQPNSTNTFSWVVTMGEINIFEVR